MRKGFGQDGEGLIGDDVDGVIVDLLDFLDLTHIGLHVRSIGLGTFIAEDNVIGRKRRAIMKLHSFAEIKTPCSGIGGFPVSRQSGRQLEVLVAPDQGLIHVFIYRDLQGLIQRMRIQRHGITLIGNAQGHGTCKTAAKQHGTTKSQARGLHQYVGFELHV